MKSLVVKAGTTKVNKTCREQELHKLSFPGNFPILKNFRYKVMQTAA